MRMREFTVECPVDRIRRTAERGAAREVQVRTPVHLLDVSERAGANDGSGASMVRSTRAVPVSNGVRKALARDGVVPEQKEDREEEENDDGNDEGASGPQRLFWCSASSAVAESDEIEHELDHAFVDAPSRSRRRRKATVLPLPHAAAFRGALARRDRPRTEPTDARTLATSVWQKTEVPATNGAPPAPSSS